MTLHPGEVVNNRYRVLKQLGQGGFGTVYRVEDLSLKTICALKENLEYWDEAQRQFEREAHLLAGLRHPSLPRVIDYFTLPAQGQYLVMDFVEGRDLQEVVDRTGAPLFQKQALDWIDQISDALIYLHGRTPPIIHRDIKPANIRLTPSGRAMLVDFGVAKRYDPDNRTTPGARAVTPGYSPVEQYGQGTTDTRADIYALGATLYTLLTARRPPESIERVTGKPLPEPRQLNPEISPQVEQVILRAMEVLASDRFQTVEDFRQSLKDAYAAASGHSRRMIKEAPEPDDRSGDSLSPTFTTTGSRSPASRSDSMSGPPYNVAGAPRPSYKTELRIEWVEIPAGEFLYGEDKHTLFLPAFQIARYPVTNLQYRYFLLANPQHPAPAHWKERSFPARKALHPVVGVSYHDALAFCNWLGCRLPTDQEWEKAARGTDGRSYPWGEEWQDGRYCNHWGAMSSGTTPVDRYPEGRSPYDVWDMAGNVWEWTSSEYQSPLMRQLCGGSWRSFSQFAVRATQRDWMLLEEGREDLGFRCALSI
jgi:serine/threonine protein kinase